MSALDDFGRFARHRVARGGPYGLGLTLAFAVTVLTLAAFVGIVDAVTDGGDLARLDAGAHTAVYTAVGPEHEALALGVTFWGNNATMTTIVVLVAALMLLLRRWTDALRIVAASGLGGLVILGLKGLFARARPVDQIIAATGYSLPSGHAFGSTVLYGMLIYLVWRTTANPALRVLSAVLGVGLIAAVGLSRVYLNVHFLTDVVAGWAAGTAWLVSVLIVVHLMETRWATRRQARAERARSVAA